MYTASTKGTPHNRINPCEFVFFSFTHQVNLQQGGVHPLERNPQKVPPTVHRANRTLNHAPTCKTLRCECGPKLCTAAAIASRAKQAVLCPPVATNRPILDDPCLYNVHAQRGCCLIGHARPANLTAMSPTMAASANPNWRRQSTHAMLLDHNWQHRCVHGPILRSHHGFA